MGALAGRGRGPCGSASPGSPAARLARPGCRAWCVRAPRDNGEPPRGPRGRPDRGRSGWGLGCAARAGGLRGPARRTRDSGSSHGTLWVSVRAAPHGSPVPAGPLTPAVAWFWAFKFMPRGGGGGGGRWRPRRWPGQSRLGAILGESRDGVCGVSPAASLRVLNFSPRVLPGLPSALRGGRGSGDLNIHDFL